MRDKNLKNVCKKRCVIHHKKIKSIKMKMLSNKKFEKLLFPIRIVKCVHIKIMYLTKYILNYVYRPNIKQYYFFVAKSAENYLKEHTACTNIAYHRTYHMHR